ncbi:DUF3307 domain-containing protein [Alkaliflexus imshenetskii]|uniref:DUF3307 domain-containing protein n=1 Tax=Alkaliflexus imshenetskii TaxID=286730 RepID=UPI00047D9079|nr:DUF3307 domain-containing protein [Alkaliflexus imshenetskii]
MNFLQLLTLQLIAHLLADFFFQTDKWVEDKNSSGIRSRYFLMHLALVFITSWLLSFQWQFIAAAGTITLLHAIIDMLKSMLSRSYKVRRYLFFIDQMLHLGVLVGVTWWYCNTFPIEPWFRIVFSERTLFIVFAFLFCTKPANILIRELFNLYRISAPKTESSSKELPNAGKLIGNMERLLTLTFMLIGRFEAVGLLIAAKSILRFGEKDTLKSEYVVVGTLLSFGIAIFIGVILMFVF